MDYSKNYFQATFLVDKIRKAAAEGNKTRLYSGLGARMEENEKKLEDFDTIKAQYMQSVQDMFAGIKEQEQQDEGLDSIPIPKRNPEYWKTAPLLDPISAAETDENISAILNTIKAKESSGDYTVKNAKPKQTASGGYGYTDGTWRMMTARYGIGTEYKSAKDAPPEIQDLVAATNVREILLENNNDVTKVPLVWYTGNVRGEISQKALEINDGMTPAQYQTDWMRRYNKMLGG